jgi:hypothetical protein
LLKQKIKLKEHTPFAKKMRQLIKELFVSAIADYNQTLDSLGISVLARLAKAFNVENDGQLYSNCLEAFMMANILRLKPKDAAFIVAQVKERVFSLQGKWVYNSSTSGLVQLG